MQPESTGWGTELTLEVAFTQRHLAEAALTQILCWEEEIAARTGKFLADGLISGRLSSAGAHKLPLKAGIAKSDRYRKGPSRTHH